MKKYSFQKVTVNYSAVKGRVTKYRAELPWIILGNEWFDQEEADPTPLSSNFTLFERREARFVDFFFMQSPLHFPKDTR